jgi:hypothetical protein
VPELPIKDTILKTVPSKHLHAVLQAFNLDPQDRPVYSEWVQSIMQHGGPSYLFSASFYTGEPPRFQYLNIRYVFPPEEKRAVNSKQQQQPVSLTSKVPKEISLPDLSSTLSPSGPVTRSTVTPQMYPEESHGIRLSRPGRRNGKDQFVPMQAGPAPVALESAASSITMPSLLHSDQLADNNMDTASDILSKSSDLMSAE